MQVTLKGDLYNIYTDTHGEQQTSLLGNVKDLRQVKVKEIGGIPIEKLQAHYEIQRNRSGKKDAGLPDTVIGFPDIKSRVPLPPGTVNVYKVHPKVANMHCVADVHCLCQSVAAMKFWNQGEQIRTGPR